jgi:hypothetical protein
MKLITEAQHNQLLANGHAARDAASAGIAFNPKPVVKIVTPKWCCRWLLTAIDPTDTDRAYGLLDSGNGRPYFGFVELHDLEGLHGEFALAAVRDDAFVADKPNSSDAEVAYTRGLIIT